MLEAPLGLSHPQTSFIGTVCQGIHHTPLQATRTTHPGTAGNRKPTAKTPLATQIITQMITHKTIKHQTPKSPAKSTAEDTPQKGVPCSRPLSSSQTTTRHTIRPATQDRPPRMGIEPRHRNKPVGWRSGSPKAYPYHSRTGRIPSKPLISSTPASPCETVEPFHEHGAHTGHGTVS